MKSQKTIRTSILAKIRLWQKGKIAFNKPSLTNVMLAFILIVLFFGFYYSSTEFYDRVQEIKQGVHSLFFSKQSNIAWKGSARCIEGYMSKTEYEDTLRILRSQLEPLIQKQGKNSQELIIDNIYAESLREKIRKVENEGLQREVDTQVTVYRTQHKFLFLPYRNEYTYGNPAVYRFVNNKLSFRCVCTRGTKNGMCI